ncbi:hypothetical protein V6N13_040101 [Hibiscus sabdariffa]
MDCFISLLLLASSVLRIRHSASKASRTAGRCGGDVGGGGSLDDTFALQLCVSVPTAKVLTEPVSSCA